MSAGLNFIRACVDHGARVSFGQMPRRLFVETEHGHYDFVAAFVSRHGYMPPLPVMLENRLGMPNAPGPVDYYMERLIDRSVYQAYATRVPQINEAFTNNEMTRARDLLGEVYAEINSATFGAASIDIGDAFEQAWNDYMVARDNPGMQIGMTYGQPFLDEITGGLRNGDVGTIVARPGIGKTFTITKAAVTAWQQGASIGFVSNEMMAPEIARRIIGMETGVNHDFLQRGRLSQWGEEIVENYLDRGVGGRPPFRLLIGDLSKSIADVDALIQEHAPDYVCIDASYLLKPTPGGQFRGKRFEAMAEVAEAIKGLALRRNRPILQTVQFNRSGSADDEMDLSQIGGTDAVGQVSAMVLGMRRGPAPFERSRRKYAVLKNRHGPDHLDFITRFEFNPFNMDRVEEEATGEDENGEWDGTVGTPPPNQDWGGA